MEGHDLGAFAKKKKKKSNPNSFFYFLVEWRSLETPPCSIMESWKVTTWALLPKRKKKKSNPNSFFYFLVEWRSLETPPCSIMESWKVTTWARFLPKEKKEIKSKFFFLFFGQVEVGPSLETPPLHARSWSHGRSRPGCFCQKEKKRNQIQILFFIFFRLAKTAMRTHGKCHVWRGGRSISGNGQVIRVGELDMRIYFL